ncbi:unnamed protein product [Bursaphelenchus okinawaensis]|uniref:BTB domain-containing protein n=1 Tax=Bursaphelenchus okinawaensis TaxID=465554 RepID=A0A811JRE8_9BILA|nr:unnamed protein product [Bursaphelenchus okinawaensis]CAG9079371.1 unnamed protein product [Bursaphelenchus okinawaensis]
MMTWIAMLLFIHQNIKVDNVDLAMKVLQLADRYDILLLKLQCKLLLMEDVDIERAEECQELAKKLNMDDLACKCAEVIYYNYKLLVQTHHRKISTYGIKVSKELVLSESGEVWTLSGIKEIRMAGEGNFLLRMKNDTPDKAFYSVYVEKLNYNQHYPGINGELDDGESTEYVVNVNDLKTSGYCGPQGALSVKFYGDGIELKERISIFK